MKKATAIFIFSLFLLSGSLAAQQLVSEREVPQQSLSGYFQGRLEKLYISLDKKDLDNVARYERDLLATMRTSTDPNTKSFGVNEDFRKRTIAILDEFESFTFIGAEKDSTDQHLALLEEVLAMLLR